MQTLIDVSAFVMQCEWLQENELKQQQQQQKSNEINSTKPMAK